MYPLSNGSAGGGCTPSAMAVQEGDVPPQQWQCRRGMYPLSNGSAGGGCTPSAMAVQEGDVPPQQKDVWRYVTGPFRMALLTLRME